MLRQDKIGRELSVINHTRPATMTRQNQNNWRRCRLPLELAFLWHDRGTTGTGRGQGGRAVGTQLEHDNYSALRTDRHTTQSNWRRCRLPLELAFLWHDRCTTCTGRGQGGRAVGTQLEHDIYTALRTNGQTDRRTDRQTDRRTDKQTDRQTHTTVDPEASSRGKSTHVYFRTRDDSYAPDLST